jgi:hypothetical protein
MLRRRLARDYEPLPASSEAMIHIASIDNLAKRMTDENSRPPHNRSRSWGRCPQRRGQRARTRFSQARRSLMISCLLVSWNSSWRASG